MNAHDAESKANDAPSRPSFRKSLRNPNINYRDGWFFVTTQVAHNKCALGAIVGDRCVLNALGEAVRDQWLALPGKYPELELDEFVVMPNHFHAILRIHCRPTNRKHHLGFLMSRFKGTTGHAYGKMKSDALHPDIGPHLWQFDYWDDLITSERELENQRRYVRDNPVNWTRDRYGPCTAYSFGDLALLDAPKIAFVASQGFAAGDLRPRRWGAAEAARSDTQKNTHSDTQKGGRSDMQKDAHSDTRETVDISTFTSAQEREALRRALAKGRRVIQVCPQGVPVQTDRPDIEAAGFSPQLLAACREGRALVISPQPPGSRLNKKVATWCNEYVLRHASEIWVGDIAPGGLLDTLLRTGAAVPPPSPSRQYQRRRLP